MDSTAVQTKPESQTEPTELRVIETDRQVCLIRFSPDGSLLAGGGYDSQIRLWDMHADEPALLEPVSGHKGWVQDLQFGPDGQWLFSADSWGQLRAWHVREKSLEPAWQNETAHDGWIRDLAISSSGRIIATAGRDRFVRLWSAEDGTLIRELPQLEHDLCRVAIHPTEEAVVAGDLMGRLHHWQVSTGERMRDLLLDKLHLFDRIQDVPGIFNLQFVADGSTLICAGGQPTRTGNHQGIPTVYSIDWETFEVRGTQTFGQDKDGFVFDLVWHPDGYFAAVTSGNPGAGQFLLFRPTEEAAFFTHTKLSNCHSLALHPDGRSVVVSATNRNSQGNGAVRDKEGRYLGNSSPLHVFSLPSSDDSASEISR